MLTFLNSILRVLKRDGLRLYVVILAAYILSELCSAAVFAVQIRPEFAHVASAWLGRFLLYLPVTLIMVLAHALTIYLSLCRLGNRPPVFIDGIKLLYSVFPALLLYAACYQAAFSIFPVFLPHFVVALFFGNLFMLALPIMVTERPGLLPALKRSIDLPAGHRGKLFVVAAGIVILVYLSGTLVFHLNEITFFHGMGMRLLGHSGGPATSYVTLHFGEAAIKSLVYAAGAVLIAATYYELRKSEQLPDDDLFDVFD